MTRPATVLLAAGRSSRFGTSNKLLVAIDGKAMVRLVAEMFVDSPYTEDIVVVTGHDAQSVEQALDGLPLRLCFNPDWTTGIGSSIALGVSQVSAAAPGVLVALGDMPLQSGQLLQRLASAFDAHEGRSIVYPVTAAGEQRNPVIWPRRFFGSLRALHGPEGGKSLLARLGERSVVPITTTDETLFLDVDDPKTLRTALAHQRLGERPTTTKESVSF